MQGTHSVPTSWSVPAQTLPWTEGTERVRNEHSSSRFHIHVASGPLLLRPSAQEVTDEAGFSLLRGLWDELRLGTWVDVRAGPTRCERLPKGANRWVRGQLVSAIASHMRATSDSRLDRYHTRQNERSWWQMARVDTGGKYLPGCLRRALHRRATAGQRHRRVEGSTVRRGGVSASSTMQVRLPVVE